MARVEGLPERIDPVRLAERGGRLCGSLPVARLGRLVESLCEPAGAVRVEVGFETDRGGRHLARGPITARLSVRCQRCLEPMDLAVDTELRLAFVEGDGEAHPPEGYEPVPIGGGTISLAELIEDEIILALPMAPMHEDCEFLGNRQWLYSRTESRLHGGICADPTTGSRRPRFR